MCRVVELQKSGQCSHYTSQPNLDKLIIFFVAHAWRLCSSVAAALVGQIPLNGNLTMWKVGSYGEQSDTGNNPEEKG